MPAAMTPTHNTKRQCVLDNFMFCAPELPLALRAAYATAPFSHHRRCDNYRLRKGHTSEPRSELTQSYRAGLSGFGGYREQTGGTRSPRSQLSNAFNRSDDDRFD